MPGRLSIYSDLAFKQALTTRFGMFRDDVGVLHKQYNIAPTLDIPIYTNTRVYTYAHFGLIPSWANERRNMQVNARSETVFEKSSFREAYRKRGRVMLMLLFHTKSIHTIMTLSANV